MSTFKSPQPPALGFWGAGGLVGQLCSCQGLLCTALGLCCRQNNSRLQMVFFILQPLFVAICNVWTGFQNELLLLSFLSNMTNNLQQFLEAQSQLFPEEVLTSLLEGVTVKTDEERIRETMGTESYFFFFLFFHISRSYNLNFTYRRNYTLIF